MNSTLFTADRTTHIKAVVVALIASIAVALIAIHAHIDGSAATTAMKRPENIVARAGQPSQFSYVETIAVR